MIYTCLYESPLGTVTVASENDAVIGLWFNGQKYFGSTLPAESAEHLTRSEQLTPASDVLKAAVKWLDIYFSGNEPDFLPPLSCRLTPFRKLICDILLEIPYGKTVTYAEIAAKAAKKLGKERMSAQAVGGAVGHNPISLMIPCHRVVASDGSLTGYAGGIGRKEKLLELEHADMSHLYIPKKGTAL